MTGLKKPGGLSLAHVAGHTQRDLHVYRRCPHVFRDPDQAYARILLTGAKGAENLVLGGVPAR